MVPRGGGGAALPPDPVALLDDDVARHSCPVVIGADEREPAGLPGHEVEILLFAGLDHDLRAFLIQSLGIGDLHRLQKGGRREFVQLLAPVLEVQAVGRSHAEGQAVRREFIRVTVSDFDDSDQPAGESPRKQTTPIMESRARIIWLRRCGRGDTRLPGGTQ